MDEIWQVILHSDEYLLNLANTNVVLTYLLITGIVFLESGNLFFFFLPGDGFLFMVGVVTASGILSIWLVLFIMITAAIFGYLLNYYTGRIFGRRFLRFSKVISRKHLRKTFKFFKKHGSKAIILGRFFPVIRTFTPFIAGMGRMQLFGFFRDTIAGAVLWIGLFVLVGYFFGAIPFIQQNFFLLYIGIVLLTFIPVVIAGIRRWVKTMKAPTT